MLKYEIVIYWDNQDKIFVADAPELAGCQAHGKNQTDALKNLNEAIELWLETAKEFGDKIPEPKQRNYPLNKNQFFFPQLKIGIFNYAKKFIYKTNKNRLI